MGLMSTMLSRQLVLIFSLTLILLVQFCFFVLPGAAVAGPGGSVSADSKLTTVRQSGETVVRRIEATGETVVRWVETTVGGTSYRRAREYGRQAGNKFSQFTAELPERILGLSYGAWALIFFVVFVVAFLVSVVIGFITRIAWYLALIFLVLALISWFIG